MTTTARPYHSLGELEAVINNSLDDEKAREAGAAAIDYARQLDRALRKIEAMSYWLGYCEREWKPTVSQIHTIAVEALVGREESEP